MTPRPSKTEMANRLETPTALLASEGGSAQAADAELRQRYEFVPIEEAELVVALGGDGFMLHTLHEMLDRKRLCPVFGMNRGTVGFLMNEWRIEGLAERLENAKAFAVPPLISTVTTVSGKRSTDYALNEVSLLRETRQTAVSSGSIAPDQRRGRNGLIGVNASILACSGSIGPRADRL